eukprot:7441873-Pyramimonas_sp.AAC.2
MMQSRSGGLRLGFSHLPHAAGGFWVKDRQHTVRASVSAHLSGADAVNSARVDRLDHPRCHD